jgi:hypothetical protein
MKLREAAAPTVAYEGDALAKTVHFSLVVEGSDVHLRHGLPLPHRRGIARTDVTELRLSQHLVPVAGAAVKPGCRRLPEPHVRRSPVGERATQHASDRLFSVPSMKRVRVAQRLAPAAGGERRRASRVSLGQRA